MSLKDENSIVLGQMRIHLEYRHHLTFEEMFYLFLLLGMILSALVGILLGLPVLRVRGDYLAIVTLGFGEVIRVLANNLDKPINLTNGPQGITPIQRPTLPPALESHRRGAAHARLAGLAGAGQGALPGGQPRPVRRGRRPAWGAWARSRRAARPR